MTSIQGDIEFADAKMVSGWAVAQGSKLPVTVKLVIDGSDMGQRSADLYRSDLADANIGDGWVGWLFRLDEGITLDEPHGIEATFSVEGLADYKVHKTVTFPSKEAILHVDHVRRHHVYGWAKFKGDDESRPLVRMAEGQVLLSQALACNFRGEVADAGYGDGRYGFVLPIPLEKRILPTQVSVEVLHGDHVLAAKDVYLDRGDIKILFVTDTAHEGNASRYYRAVIPSQILWKSGAETVLMDKSEVKPGSFAGFDVVILQRAPASEILLEECLSARWRQTLILYETDDLNTSYDLIPQTGAIRSMFRHPRDENFTHEIAGRLRSANVADGVIVPNEYMKRHYDAGGFHTILSPFRCQTSKILRKRRRGPSADWRLLYYSGSPTHKKDFLVFKNLLAGFMQDNPSVSLTVLGYVDRNDFIGIPRVVFKDATTYDGLLETIDDHDCVIACFEESEYNFGKSCTKFIESASRGVPLVVSAIPDYISHVENSGFGQVVTEATEWRRALGREFRRRAETAAQSAKLCDYARRVFGDQAAGNQFIEDIFAAYSHLVCNVEPGREAASDQQVDETAV